MGQQPVVKVDDITKIAFASRRPGCEKGIMHEEGAVLSTALNKYMYITVNKRFDSTVRLSYAKTEICEKVSQVQHPIFKLVLQRYEPDGGVECPGHRVPAAIPGTGRAPGDTEGRPDQDGAQWACGLRQCDHGLQRQAPQRYGRPADCRPASRATASWTGTRYGRPTVPGSISAAIVAEAWESGGSRSTGATCR